jgi:MinD-like ATPase involved in chromosome partitioning or flagellar assembly
MLVFAISDKGGTGRSVSGANIAYRNAALGDDTCYVDFDFGSPTVGAIFGISALDSGTGTGRGTHALLLGATDLPEFIDV